MVGGRGENLIVEVASFHHRGDCIKSDYISPTDPTWPPTPTTVIEVCSGGGCDMSGCTENCICFGGW